MEIIDESMTSLPKVPSIKFNVFPTRWQRLKEKKNIPRKSI